MTNKSRAMYRVVALTLVALMLGASPLAAAQRQQFDSDLYTSELTGVDIEVTGPIYEIVDAELQHYASGEGELVQIGSASIATSLEVSFFDDDDTPSGTIDIYLSVFEDIADAFEVLDRGVSGDYAYALALISYDGVDIVYYVQVYEDFQGNTDLLEAILSSSATLEDDLVAAQTEVSVDNVGFIENVNAAELSAAVSGGGSLGEEAEATPVEPFDTATFAMADVTIGIGPGFVFLGEPEVQDPYESVRIQGPDTLSLVAIGATNLGPATVLSSFSAGIISVFEDTQVVYEEIGEDTAWRILWIPKDTAPSTIMLIVADTSAMPGVEFMHAHEMPADGVAGSIVTIQSQFTMNGQPFMADIDPDEIAFYADDYRDSSASPEAPEPTEEATAAVEDEGSEGRSGNPRDGARLPDPDETDGDGEGNVSETSDIPDATAEPTSASSDGKGSLSDSSWEGGVFGHRIDWDAAVWFVDTDYPDDLVSDVDAQEDTIVLQTSTNTGNTWFFISVYGGTDGTPDDYLDYWLSPEFMEGSDLTDTNSEVLTSRSRGGGSAVVIRYTSSTGEEFVMIRQAMALEDGNMLIVTLDAPVEDAVDMYEQATGVTLDDDPVLSVLSVSQIERAIDD